MSTDRISITNIKGISSLRVEFNFPKSNIIVVTGVNGIGKTSLVKSFRLISDPKIFEKSSGLNAIGTNSTVQMEIEGYSPFTFRFNKKLMSLDTKDKLPTDGAIFAEMPIPYGLRFQQFSLISSYDSEIRSNIASGNYEDASELITFMSRVYGPGKHNKLKQTRVNKHTFYFFLMEEDYYVREDHLSSGEYFLVQIYRFVTSGAKLIIIDEIDISIDAAAQVKLYNAIKHVLQDYEARIIAVSHSLGFMSTADEGGIYYLEEQYGKVNLEQRSFGYVKSDLYGFLGKDRYIITEDKVLLGFINYLIREYVNPFFQYETIAVGGLPQIDAICNKNDQNKIFSEPPNVIIILDNDLRGKVNYAGLSKIYYSPVDDIELFIFRNKESLLPGVNHPQTNSIKEKVNSKKYWERLIRTNQKQPEELYRLVDVHNRDDTIALVDKLKYHLCLQD